MQGSFGFRAEGLGSRVWGLGETLWEPKGTFNGLRAYMKPFGIGKRRGYRIRKLSMPNPDPWPQFAL